MARRGVVGQRAGAPCVLFKRALSHSIDSVWAAVSEPRQRAVWAPGLAFDPRPGAHYRIWFGEDCEGPAHVSGVLGEFDPPRLLQLGSIRFELQNRQRPPGCVLTFSDLLLYDGKRTRAEFANAVLGGWHAFLDRLEVWLDEGRAAPGLAEPDYSAFDVPGRG